jgi:hypothetical protein
VALAAFFGSLALGAQDRPTLKVPEALARSEFRGYENWADVGGRYIPTFSDAFPVAT